MKKLLILTTLLLSSFAMTACPNKEKKDDEEEEITLPYHTNSWDNNIKKMLDKYTDGASTYVPAIPAEEYYCDYVTLKANSGIMGVQISAYNVDSYGIEKYYLDALEDNDFYIYNGSLTDGTPYRYAYRLMTVTDDLYLQYDLRTIDHTPVFSILINQRTNRITEIPDEDYQFLFGTTIPHVDAESYEAYFDNMYDSYTLFAHNTGANGFNTYYQKLAATNKYDLISEFSTSEQYYFTSKDGYTNIQFYQEYDEYNRLSLVVSVTTNSFRIETLRYLGTALPNFTDVLDARTSFLYSSIHANTFLIYFGPTTLEFYNSYSDLLVNQGWSITSNTNSNGIRTKIMNKDGVSFQYMFGNMVDTGEETIVIVINVLED